MTFSETTVSVALNALVPPLMLESGFQIADVRPNSSAAGQYLQRGDVLVGMHIWETANRDNLAFILSQPEMQSAETIRVLVLRGDKTYYAYIQPSTAAGVAAYSQQSSRR